MNSRRIPNILYVVVIFIVSINGTIINVLLPAITHQAGLLFWKKGRKALT